VRRLFEAVGARVSRLVRVRYGPLELPSDLAPGQWREIQNPVTLQKL
jgi:23S rRNA pseudouridine2605 synthase